MADETLEGVGEMPNDDFSRVAREEHDADVERMVRLAEQQVAQGESVIAKMNEKLIVQNALLHTENLGYRRSGRFQKKVIAGMAIIILVLLIVAGVSLSTNVANRQTLKKQNVVINQLKDVVDRLDHDQAGVDELVNFVHSVEQQQQTNGNGTAQAVTQIEQLICSSSDPVQQAACAKLGLQPIG